MQAEVDGERLTDEEFQWFFLLLVNAGGDTTRNLLAAGMQLLFDHPDERRRLLADLDGLLPTGRRGDAALHDPGHLLPAHGQRDTEVRGTTIAEGDKVVMFYGSANRDGDVFDDPDRVRRRPHAERRTSPSAAADRTCASACTSPGSRSRRCCARCSHACPTSRPPASRSALESNFIAGVHSMPVTFTPGRAQRDLTSRTSSRGVPGDDADTTS